MGPEAESVIRCRDMTVDQLKKYDTVKDQLTKHFIPRRNLIVERATFHKRVQESGESVDGFIKALYELIQHCEYGTLREELIRDRLVVGLRDQKLSEKLQMDEKLTLDTAKRICLEHENIKKQQSLLQGETQSVEAVAINKSTTSPSMSEMHRSPNSSCPQTQCKNCGWCGRSPHSRQTCPVKIPPVGTVKRGGILQMSVGLIQQ